MKFANRAPKTPKNEPQILLQREVRGSFSGKTYKISVTGFYDQFDVLNVEFHYGDIDPIDEQQLKEWQDAYVASLGFRVYLMEET